MELNRNPRKPPRLPFRPKSSQVFRKISRSKQSSIFFHGFFLKKCEGSCKRKSTNAPDLQQHSSIPRVHLLSQPPGDKRKCNSFRRVVKMTGIVKSWCNSISVQDSSQWKYVITIGYMKFIEICSMRKRHSVFQELRLTNSKHPTTPAQSMPPVRCQ